MFFYESVNPFIDKLAEIENILVIENELSIDQEQLVASIEAEINLDERFEFYRLWNKRSTWLSNRVSQVINSFIINV